MRIIAGEAKGRRLFAPAGSDTRPTSDRTRESLFSILAGRVPGARVLDLFAGSGALGLEALSRGAAFAVFCDASAAAAGCLRRNIESVGADEKSRLWQADWRKALARETEAFDLVFLDPPYRMTEVYGEALGVLANRRLIGRETCLVLEYDRRTPPVLPEGFGAEDTRVYRDTAVSFARWKGKE